MAPITLFFGPNSSGKSSIGQFLMMLKQTVEFPDRKAVFYSGSRDSAVELGSYSDMVFHHDIDKHIHFDYHWDTTNIMAFKDSLSSQRYEIDNFHFSADVGQVSPDKSSPSVFQLLYKLYHGDDKIFDIAMEKIKQKGEYRVETDNYQLLRNIGRVWNPGAPVRFYGFPDVVVAYYRNADFVQSINLEHEKLFRACPKMFSAPCFERGVAAAGGRVAG
jgi:hypothetical protein